MNRKTLFFAALLIASLTSCSSGGKSTGGNTPGGEDNIIHGRGVPSNDIGSLYSLYVDDNDGKIYEKNKEYVNATTNLRRSNSDDSKWIYTNCVAGDNFDKNSAIADAIRSTLLSTNVTLRCDLGIETSFNGDDSNMDVVTYIQYNFGNVLQKQVVDKDNIDGAILVGYSLYDINNDSYRLFLNSGGTIVDHTDYITSDDAGERLIASNFINRCLNNQLEKSLNFPLVDNILSEIDNFTSVGKSYSLDKTINVGSNPYYDQMYGPGNYYIEFKDISFTLSEDSLSLTNLHFVFEYGTKDKSQVLKEDFSADISNLRTTSFDIPR